MGMVQLPKQIGTSRTLQERTTVDGRNGTKRRKEATKNQRGFRTIGDYHFHFHFCSLFDRPSKAIKHWFADDANSRASVNNGFDDAVFDLSFRIGRGPFPRFILLVGLDRSNFKAGFSSAKVVVELPGSSARGLRMRSAPAFPLQRPTH